MAYTNAELASEFWMLTKGMLQDSSIDTDEAKVLKRWIEEHDLATTFKPLVDRLESFLADGYISRYESQSLLNTFGSVLAHLRRASAS